MSPTPPIDLASARDHLAKAESMLMTEDGLHHLQEGLALLEAVLDGSPVKQTESVALNLGRTYTSRIYEYIRREVEKNRALAEPELEHVFAVIRAFDEASFDLPPESKGLKVTIVRRLIDLYYEGYTPGQKEEVFKKLAEISR
ncbi:MAG TPA: hypothetical protein VIC71_10360 [Gammaproteobacteria bacterium]|jgi:hypothetical protein